MDANTTKRLAEIRQRADAATCEKWKVYINGNVIEIATVEKPAIVSWLGFDDCLRSAKQHAANARFIAHSRQDIPYLLDLIQNKDAEIARLMKAIMEYWRHGNAENLQEIGVEVALASQETKEMETEDKEKIK